MYPPSANCELVFIGSFANGDSADKSGDSEDSHVQAGGTFCAKVEQSREISNMFGSIPPQQAVSCHYSVVHAQNQLPMVCITALPQATNGSSQEPLVITTAVTSLTTSIAALPQSLQQPLLVGQHPLPHYHMLNGSI